MKTSTKKALIPILEAIGTTLLLALIFLSDSELISSTAEVLYVLLIPEIVAALDLAHQKRSLKFSWLAFLCVFLLNGLICLFFYFLSSGSYPGRIEELVPLIAMFAVPALTFSVFYVWKKGQLRQSHPEN